MTEKANLLQPAEWKVLSNLFPVIHALPELAPQHWQQQKIRAGERLFQPGLACQRFVLLGEGRVRMQMTNDQGRRMTLYRLQPGNLCIHSLINLINDQRYSIEAIVETPGWLSWVPARQFNTWMAESAGFREWILASIGERLKHLLDHCADITFSSVEHRLADHLLESMGADGAVHTTQAEIAAELGSAREVVLRLLRRWEASGWIVKSRGSLQITDIQALLNLLDTAKNQAM